jgi:hypothetical protein
MKHLLSKSSFTRSTKTAFALSLIALVFIFFVPSSSAATNQAPSAEWTKNFNDIKMMSVIQTSDGGYALVGTNPYGLQTRFIKTNMNGELQWQKTYNDTVFGGSKNIVAVSQTADLGYLLFGDGGYIVKTNSEGNVQWYKSSGFIGVCVGMKTVYGNYMLVGNNAPGSSWVLKIDEEANTLWSVSLTGGYVIYAAAVTSNEGCTIAGSYKDKFWCGQINLNGGTEWSRVYSYGGLDDIQHITNVLESSDGGFLLTGIGEWQASGGNVPWLIKIDSLGNEQWHHNYENLPLDGFTSAVQVEDGGYVVALSSSPTLFWVTDLGEMMWNATYGTSIAATAFFMGTIDGGFAIAEVNGMYIKIMPESGISPTSVVILSPESKTYSTGDVPLTYNVSKLASWIGYSLNGQTNVTITGNTALKGLNDGSYTVTVYVKDAVGNSFASKTISFTVAKNQTAAWLVIPVVVVVAVVLLSLLAYFKKLSFMKPRLGAAKQRTSIIMGNRIVRTLFIIGLCVLMGASQLFLPYFYFSSTNRQNSPFQVGVTYAYEYDKIGQIYTEVVQIQSLGFKVIRANLVCNPSNPSDLSNSQTEEFIMATQQVHISVALIINQHNTVDAVSYYLNRWGSHISYIQVLNEPELSSSWAAGALYTDDELFTKFQQFYTVVAPYHSTAKLYTNFETGFLLRPNIPVELSKNLDFVGYDVFMDSFLTLSPRMIQFLGKITDKPVVISEFGMSTSDDKTQADFIIKGLNLFKSMGLSSCWIAYWNNVDNLYGIRDRLAEQKVGEWIAQNS